MTTVAEILESRTGDLQTICKTGPAVARGVKESERRARGHRLIIIVVVALVLVAVVTVVGTVRARSLASNTDTATADLRAKWGLSTCKGWRALTPRRLSRKTALVTTPGRFASSQRRGTQHLRERSF
jgi:hypothetical protein